MHSKEQLVDQHIREYDSRQSHVDELLERAHRHAENKPDIHEDLGKLTSRHKELVSHLEDLRQGKIDKHAVQAIEEAGPMGIWYGLISELETLLEGLED